MKKYLLKWAAAGLIWPLFYGVSYTFIGWSQDWLLLFWPSSIVLMSLGAGPNETWYVVYVFSVGAAMNMFTYLLLGLFIKFVIAAKKRTDEENS